RPHGEAGGGRRREGRRRRRAHADGGEGEPMTRPGLLRNLEQIQETDGRPRGPRVGTLLLASLGAACVIFAIVSQSKRKAPMTGRAPDPLGELVAQAKGAKPADSADLGGRDVTFPPMLSDDARPTTAPAAVRAGSPGSWA